MPIYTVKSPFCLLVETMVLKVSGLYALVPVQDLETGYAVPLGIYTISVTSL